jgi:hypothetical protein
MARDPKKVEVYKENKKLYNSSRSTFQINKELHKKVKQYCLENNLKVQEFLEEIIETYLK